MMNLFIFASSHIDIPEAGILLSFLLIFCSGPVAAIIYNCKPVRKIRAANQFEYESEIEALEKKYKELREENEKNGMWDYDRYKDFF